MIGVASQIVFCIFAAAVIGSIAGYLLRGLRHGARIADIERLWQARLTARDEELDTLRANALQANLAAGSEEPALLQAKAREPVPTGDDVRSTMPTMSTDPGQFESKLSQVLSLVEKLAKSQERMESELITMKSAAAGEFKLEPSQPKS